MASAIVTSSLILSCDFLRGYAEGESGALGRYQKNAGMLEGDTLGAARFLLDDFNSLNTDALETNALPFKLVVAAMATAHPDWFGDVPSEEQWLGILEQRYGFVRAQRVANWSNETPPPLTRPMGIVDGVVARDVPKVRMEVINHGCATCHAGSLWDDQGLPTRDVWLGLPSTSINLARYSDDVYRALQRASRETGPTIAMLDRIYPNLSADERRTLVQLVLPAVRDGIGKDSAPHDAVPFDNGGPGLTNSVGHVKRHFHILDAQHATQELAFTQIPELFSMKMRSSVLCDGVYTPAGDEPFVARTVDAPGRRTHTMHLADVVTLFTVGTLGVHPNKAHANHPAVKDVMGFLDAAESPPFPGPLDETLAQEGVGVWTAQCASCHGTLSLSGRRSTLTSFPNLLVSTDDIGTDPERVRAADENVLKVIDTVPLGKKIDVHVRGGYIAPALLGLWATAPYLHNGAVPTLWHLMHPEARPAKFLQGGHALDHDKVGIRGELVDGVYRYPANFTPWTEPALFDATKPGRRNIGHEAPFSTMREDEKAALLELLKTL